MYRAPLQATATNPTRAMRLSAIPVILIGVFSPLLVAALLSAPVAFAQQAPAGSPGPAGASHLYHVGATGFFLDQSAMITLAAAQQAALTDIKKKWSEGYRITQPRIIQAEQELWTLTGADNPDSTALESKVREIERLKGEQRITFIESVGEAVDVLTLDQRAALPGVASPATAQMTPPQGPASSVTLDAPAPGGHLGHHPGGTAAVVPDAPMAPPGAQAMAPSAPAAIPATPPAMPGAPGMAGGGMGDMMGGMMEMMGKMIAPAIPGAAGMAGMPASAAPGGCMGAGCGPGAGGTPIYPSLMTLPALTAGKRAEIEALATQQINEGNSQIAAGTESLHRATQVGDHAAMQQAVGQMHEGLDQLGAGIAARRVLSEGKSPRNLALDWFKREMNLASPITADSPQTSGGVKTFHLVTMLLLVAFAVAMIVIYVLKMRRAAALFGRLEGGPGGPPPPGSSPTLPGAPGPSSPVTPPSGGAPPPATPHEPPLAAKWRGQLRVGSIVTETPSVKTLRLVPSSGDGLMPFTFLPGQFLNLAFWIGGAKMNRSYSISSSPTQRGYADLTVRREPRGAVSRHVDDLLPGGDLIEAAGPVGRFTFTGAEANSIVLIAGGVGVTPMMSIARYLTERSWAGGIYFFYACRAPPDFIFAHDLAALEQINSKLHVSVTMEHPEGTDWQGPRGRITRELLTQTVPDLTSRRFHLCGPPVMMDAIKALLTELGVPPDQVKTEDFGTAAPTPAEAGTSAQRVAPATGPLVKFSKNNKSSRSRGNQTVLELSEELGIGIEFSCRVGTCGVCKVAMTVGEVEMAVEDGLDVDEKAKGIILACQAKPKADLVVEA